MTSGLTIYLSSKWIRRVPLKLNEQYECSTFSFKVTSTSFYLDHLSKCYQQRTVNENCQAQFWSSHWKLFRSQMVNWSIKSHIPRQILSSISSIVKLVFGFQNFIWHQKPQLWGETILLTQITPPKPLLRYKLWFLMPYKVLE